MTTRPLEEQFAALPKEIQWRMFSVLDVVIGMSHDEKALTADGLKEMGRHEKFPEELRTVLYRLGSLVTWADVYAQGRTSIDWADYSSFAALMALNEGAPHG